MKKILIFGAGKIGRSFIGQLFSRAGYEVVFADISKNVVDLLNETKSYKVITRDSNFPEKEGEYVVSNVSAVHLSEKDLVINHIVDTDIISLSVGKRGLLSLADILAPGIKKRYENKKDQPIDIILAENVRNAAALLGDGLKKRLPDLPVDHYVGLVETSIGKMVPIMTGEQLARDPLSVYAEAYNTLILDAKGFRNEIPDVPGLAPKNNMKAWVDRKLFIHNMGHATLAYQTNYLHPEIKYTWEALKDKELRAITRKTMIQSAEILLAIYPGEFTMDQLTDHIDDLLLRFSNKALGDTIFRVGCDLPRKLNVDDRLMVPVISGKEKKMDYSLILEAWVKGCSFNATDNQGKLLPEDRQFKEKFGENPLRILRDYCKLEEPEYSEIYENVRKIQNRLSRIK